MILAKSPPSSFLRPKVGAPPLTRAPSTQNSIPDLRKAIDSLNTKLALLLSQRTELEDHLRHAVLLESPVLRLPSELLSSIFVLGVNDADPEEDAVLVPILMLVCRYWAQVVIDTPALWSRISVGAHDSLAKARTRIERSKSTPLHLSISFDARDTQLGMGGVMETVIKAMELFSPALWRTRSFHLSVPTRAHAHAALQRCQGEEAPYLEDLSVTIHHLMLDDHSHSTPPLPLFKGHTPKLRTCSFASFNFGWDVRILKNLRSLHLSGYFNGFSPTVERLLDALRACPQLETLSLRNMSDTDCDYASDCDDRVMDVEMVDPRRVISLPKLTSASFNNAGLLRVRRIMANIAFPALQKLELSYLQDITSILQRLHTQSLTRLPLKHLRIESCFFNEARFMKVLQRVSLTELELVDVEDASSTLLKGMSTVKPYVCPRLTRLTLDGCTSVEWDSLRAFIESRLPPNLATFSTTGTGSTSASEWAMRQAALKSSASSSSLSSSNGTTGNTTTSTITTKTVTTGGTVTTTTTTTTTTTKATSSTSQLKGPTRIEYLDVSRCHQLSREMIQWLRMYVERVRCEKAKCFN